MYRLFFTALLLLSSVTCFAQEISVNPRGVNVSSQGATSVFLTFGRLGSYRAAEALWCGELIPADPDIGLKCNPATVYGSLPARYDQSRSSGASAFTDIMSIPPSVARRAYLAAARGSDSRFFYVRHFVNTAGGPDQYVAVTCRLTGGGARVPFSLTDVKLRFDVARNEKADPLALFVEPGGKMPTVKAEISYTGTGRLKGRWEIVQPGDELPEARDLLTEAALPVEARGFERRYTQLERFNVFLPPVGRFILNGPEPTRLPSAAAGQYLVLLRIEATDDREADSDLSVVGAGAGVVHSGGVAGFPIPVLRYVVGSGNAQTSVQPGTSTFALLLPAENAVLPQNRPIDFIWSESPQAAFYRLELEDINGNPILSAVLQVSARTYRAPSWLKEKSEKEILRWRVVALDQTGIRMSETAWRNLRVTPEK